MKIGSYPNTCCNGLAMNFGLTVNCVATEPSTIRMLVSLDPQQPAIVSPDLRRLTFGELDRTIRQIGDELNAAGILAGSRVGPYRS